MSNENSKDKKVANVPNLRFLSFSQSWKRNPLKRIVSFSKGSGISKGDLSDQGRNCILYGQLYTDYSNVTQVNQTTLKTPLNQSDLVISLAGQVLIPASGETHEDISNSVVINVPGVLIGGDINILTPKQEILGSFLACCFRGVRKKQIASLAQGDSVVHLNSNNLSKLIIDYPSIDEQARITAFIRLLEARIEVQNKIIQDIDTLRIHTLTSLKTIAVFGKKQLSGLLQERIEKNKASFEICSVAVIEGVVNQIEHLGRSFSAKNTSNYKVVHYGDVVYTKSPTGLFPFGIIKQSLQINEVAISPLYAVYKPSSFNVGLYLHFYFLSPTNTNNYLKPLVEKGAKNTMNISNQRAVSGYVPFPNDDCYLEKLCNFLILLDRKKEKEKNLLQLFIQEKRYLLQNLFI